MTDKSAAAIRELAYKHAEPKVIWNDGNMSIYPDEEKIESLLSDLTALISEGYVSKEEYNKVVQQRDELKEENEKLKRQIQPYNPYPNRPNPRDVNPYDIGSVKRARRGR